MHVSSSNLRFLVDFFRQDYRDYDKDIYHQMITLYNINFIYNNFATKDMYIGFAEWEIDEEMCCPHIEDFPTYVNQTNSCKINQ